MSMRPGVDTGSVMNLLMSQHGSPAPKRGMGATILMWTDRIACTVVATGWRRPNNRSVTVQEDRAIRTDDHGMSDAQAYRYEPDPNGLRHTFTLRKNGAWVKERDPMKGGTRLMLGAREHYHDYSF